MTQLLDPIALGDLAFANRVAMAPITRARAGDGGVPTVLNAAYYGQRATAGLIITEATNVSPNSAAFEPAPGIYTEAQVAGWRLVIEAVLEVMPAHRVGVRSSPFAAYSNAGDPDAAHTYAYVARMLEQFGVGYIHGADTNAWGGTADMPKILEIVRANYRGVRIANAGLTPEAAQAMVAAGQADMVAFGRAYVANPDLVARIAANGPYNTPDPHSFYGGTERGYTDYPALV